MNFCLCLSWQPLLFSSYLCQHHLLIVYFSYWIKLFSHSNSHSLMQFFLLALSHWPPFCSCTNAIWVWWQWLSCVVHTWSGAAGTGSLGPRSGRTWRSAVRSWASRRRHWEGLAISAQGRDSTNGNIFAYELSPGLAGTLSHLHGSGGSSWLFPFTGVRSHQEPKTSPVPSCFLPLLTLTSSTASGSAAAAFQGLTLTPKADFPYLQLHPISFSWLAFIFCSSR